MFSDFSGNAKEKLVEISSYIKSAISLAKQREDPRAHEAVFKEVPIQMIESQVKEKFKELFQQDPSTSVKIMRDLAVYELVSWFKKDFFKWVDAFCSPSAATTLALASLAASASAASYSALILAASTL